MSPRSLRGSYCFTSRRACLVSFGSAGPPGSLFLFRLRCVWFVFCFVFSFCCSCRLFGFVVCGSFVFWFWGFGLSDGPRVSWVGPALTWVGPVRIRVAWAGPLMPRVGPHSCWLVCFVLCFFGSVCFIFLDLGFGSSDGPHLAWVLGWGFLLTWVGFVGPRVAWWGLHAPWVGPHFLWVCFGFWVSVSVVSVSCAWLLVWGE